MGHHPTPTLPGPRRRHRGLLDGIDVDPCLISLSAVNLGGLLALVAAAGTGPEGGEHAELIRHLWQELHRADRFTAETAWRDLIAAKAPIDVIIDVGTLLGVEAAIRPK